jgi:hypothetical protein
MFFSGPEYVSANVLLIVGGALGLVASLTMNGLQPFFEFTSVPGAGDQGRHFQAYLARVAEHLVSSASSCATPSIAIYQVPKEMSETLD